MARNFLVASAQGLTDATTPPVTTLPFSLAAWFKTAGGSGYRSIITLSEGSTEFNFALLDVATGGQVSAYHQGNSGVVGNALTAGTVTDAVWTHGGAVFTSESSRTAYINGVGTTETTTVAAFSALNYIAFGLIQYNGAPTNYFNGDIAEGACWNVALTAAEMESMADGVSPLLIRPQSLMAYWPLYGNDSPELDRYKGTTGLTLVNTPAKAAHPRIIRPFVSFTQ